MEKNELLKEITEKYLSSEEFNGYPLHNKDDEKENIITLIKENKIELNFSDRHPNPHIKAFDCESIKTQINKIDSIGIQNACAYPTKNHLKTKIYYGKYKNKPFTRKIALGEPTLNFGIFDLSVLEIYRNDPRYSYSTNDIGGDICISDEHYKSLDVKPSDKILLQTFGFCYEKETLNRAVAVFYRYLANLSAEHQKIWESKVLEGDYFLHPDYARSSAGDWPEKVSIFDAFTEELHIINEYSKLMNRPLLFKQDFHSNKPRDFGFLIRPTKKELNSFVHLLDKMISDNINKEFFMNEIESDFEEVRRDGKIKVTPKGTITLLNDWIDKKVKFPNPEPKNEMIKSFKKIRQMRQPEAHKINDNIFNQKYFKEQRDLIIEAYNSIRTLRLILANHPKTKEYKISDWIYKGEIWTF